MDVSNGGLERHPEFALYLKSNAPAATLIKSASYLLQDAPFSGIRRTILDTTAFLLQDDSGLPYRFLSKKNWDVTLYGDYLGPKRDFKTGFQPDLSKAYKEPGVTKSASPGAASGAAKPLPFHFGYHWEENRESCVQVALKTARSR